MGAGMQQAMDYAEILDIPFAYSSNGDGFIEHDFTRNDSLIEREIGLDEFPSPEQLWQRYRQWKGIKDKDNEIITHPYYSDGGGKRPRYYQLNAINRTVEAIAKANQRILLVMATGTGKTFTAFQIIWRLWKSRTKKRILFLADRNILVDQTKTNDFKPFGQAMTKIKKRQVDKSYEIYLALYQAVTGNEQEKNIYKQFSPDFFDLVVVDECHRGSAAEDSAWRDILDYFSSATQIGLTATPKETKDISNIDYFGEPIYTYSLKQGIEDGFLAPYKVIRIDIDKDLIGWRPKAGQLDKYNQFIEDRIYNQTDMNRSLVLEDRDILVAEKIAEFLKGTNRFSKTIIFCEDIDHAERMRRALVVANSDLVAQNSRYVVKITGDDKIGKEELDNFILPDSPYPVLVTTSKLMTTGVDGDAQRISQLTWMLFLKIFDDREMEAELFEDDYISAMPEGLRWRDWAADNEGITGDELLEFVNSKLFRTLKNLDLANVCHPKAKILKEAFEDGFNFMKSGTLIRQVINKINEIDFNNSQDKHLFGEIYEQILKDLQNAGNAGEYYTPRAVTQFMVDMINPKLGERILDPACGTGGFLTCALNHLRKQVKTVEDKEKLSHLIMGVEKKPLPHLLCITNLLLHEIDVPKIRRDNTLARPLRDYKPLDKVEVILTNPPFGGKEEDGIETGFPKAYQTKETADLFLVLIMQLLKVGGRGAIVLPDGTLFGEGVKTRIKEKLLSECNLHTIVRLPNGVFNPYTSIKTNLLFFTKGEPTETIWFYEHPYPPGYKSYSKTKPIKIEKFAAEKAWWNNREENEFAWCVSLEEIKANGYNLDIKNPYQEREKHRDLGTILEDYQRLIGEISNTQKLLKNE